MRNKKVIFVWIIFFIVGEMLFAYLIGRRMMKQAIGQMQLQTLGALVEALPEQKNLLVRTFCSPFTSEHLQTGMQAFREAGFGNIGIRNLGYSVVSQELLIILLGMAATCLAIAYLWYRSETELQHDVFSMIQQVDEAGGEGTVSLKRREMQYLEAAWKEKEENLSRQEKILFREKKQLIQYLENIAHQIKSPIASISLTQEYLLSEEEDEEKKEILKECGEKIDAIRKMVSVLLQTARLDADAVSMRVERNSVMDCLQYVIHNQKERVAEKEITLTYEHRGELWAVFDKFWVLEALNNLIDNAIEYTKDGEQVEISSECDEQWLKILVKDHGDGISEDSNYIFTRYYTSRVNDHSKAGIGLNLVAQIANRHGGNAKVLSHRGAGTWIQFQIPNIPGKSKEAEISLELE